MMHSLLSRSCCGFTPMGHLREQEPHSTQLPSIELQLHQGHAGEETVKGPQGAEDAAEGPADEDGQDEENGQYGDLVPEIEAQGGHKLGLSAIMGRAPRERPRRAQEFAKTGVAQPVVASTSHRAE